MSLRQWRLKVHGNKSTKNLAKTMIAQAKYQASEQGKKVQAASIERRREKIYASNKSRYPENPEYRRKRSAVYHEQNRASRSAKNKKRCSQNKEAILTRQKTNREATPRAAACSSRS